MITLREQDTWANALEVTEPRRLRFLKLSLAVLLSMASTALPSRAHAEGCSPEAATRNRAATVLIRVKKTLKATGAVEERAGTGVVVSPSGYLLTNRHVIETDERVDETEISGAIASREAPPFRLTLIASNQHDVALLKFADTSKAYAAAPLGTPVGIAIGTTVCSGSFPKSMEYFFGSGLVSGFGGDHGYWLTDMTSNPGDSGAPVFTITGQVIALKVGGYSGLQSVNAIIPLNLANDLLILVPDLVSPSGVMPSVSTKHAEVGAAEPCEFLRKYQGDESQLALLGEKAFSQQNYVCTVVYLEQAQRVEVSKVWERDYPYLAAARLLSGKGQPAFQSTLSEMLAEMRLPNSFLHHGPPIGMALQNLTEVRQYVNSEAQAFIDETIIPAAVGIKQNLTTP